MGSEARPRLGELLLRHGLISPAQLEQALHTQEESAKHVGEILVETGAISEGELAEMLELQRQLAEGGRGDETDV